MRNATPAFMRALAEDRRDYVNRLAITLADGTVLQGTETTYDVDTGTETVTTTNYLTNENLWEDGMKMEDSVSADDVFQIGAAIINSATFTLNNIDDRFSPYSFDGARCIWTVGLADLDDGTSDFMQMGTFIVDETDYDGSVITLKCLDNMSKFDKPYDTTLVYPATLGAIVRDACTKCGVTLATNSLQFPHYTYQVTNKPSSESTTYRQVISWAAQIAVCFARCNTEGQLEFKFYNTSALDDAADDLDGGVFDSSTPYASGDSADGGSFNPWNTGYVYDGGNFTLYPQMHYIGSAFSHKVATDDVVITGVRVQKKIETEGSSTAYQTYTYGTDGYIVSIEGNDFIDGTHGEDVKNWMGTALVGLVFRKAEVQHPNDPTFEAGDVAYYWDRKGNRYTLLVSSTTFSCNSSQRTVSAAETPAKNSAQKFTESTRNYVEMRKQLAKQQTSWETAAEALARQIANASGLHETDVVESGATVKYYHDKPNLEDSEVAMVFNDLGFFVCDDYKTKTDAGEDPTWVGLQVNGSFLARQIDTIDLFFSYAHGGTLKLGGHDNENGKLEILDGNGDAIGRWSNAGLISTGYTSLATVDGSKVFSIDFYAGRQRFILNNTVIGYFDASDTGLGTTYFYLYYKDNFIIEQMSGLSGSGRIGIDTSGVGLSGSAINLNGTTNVGNNSDPANNRNLYVYGDASILNNLYVVNGYIHGTLASSSDKRLKHNISESDMDALALLKGVKTYSYDWNDERKGHVELGFIADQLQEVVPEAITEGEQSEDPDKDSLLYIENARLLPYCVKAIQELSSQVEAMKAEIETLKQKLAEKGE